MMPEEGKNPELQKNSTPNDPHPQHSRCPRINRYNTDSQRFFSAPPNRQSFTHLRDGMATECSGSILEAHQATWEIWKRIADFSESLGLGWSINRREGSSGIHSRPSPFPGASMQPPLRPSRNPLDLAFWGLIVAICVVMGGGIYAMGVRGRPTSRGTTAQNAPLSGPNQAQSSGDDPVQFGGNIEPDSSSAPRRFSKPLTKGVSYPSGDLSGIEERLDAIASNLGELTHSVHRHGTPNGSASLEPTVEFVREFRHLLEAGQRTLQPGATDREDRRSWSHTQRQANPISDESTAPEDLPAPQAFLGEEEPAAVTAQASPTQRTRSSASDVTPDSTPRQQESDPLTEDDSPNAPEIENFLPDDREEATTDDTPQTTQAETESSAVTEARTETMDAEEELSVSKTPSIPGELVDTPSALTDTETTGNDLPQITNPEQLHEQDLHALEADDPSHVSRLLPPPVPGRSTPPQLLDPPSDSDDDLDEDLAKPTAPTTQEETPLTAIQLYYPKHRTAEQLLPQIQKYLTPGIGKVTATNNLVRPKARGVGPETTRRHAIAVKDTHAALQQIAEMLEQTDVAPPKVPETSPEVEFTVDVTAVGVRVSPQQPRGIDLQELSSASGPYTLWAHPTDRVLKCAAGLPNDRDGRLKLAIFNGEEASLLRDLRVQGPLQAVARSRVTMKSTEASRLVVEQESVGGRRDRGRDHSIGVRPVIHSDGSLRLQVLPGTDAQGRPIEQAQKMPEPIGEVELRQGETAVLAGILQSQPSTAKNRSASNRGRLANEAEVVEWIYLITPQNHSPLKTTTRSSQGRPSNTVARRILEQRQTAAR